VDQEAIRKIIEYREKLKKERRGEYHHLQFQTKNGKYIGKKRFI
jgi:hypothetical protein